MSTEFESNPVLIDQSWIESTAGSNSILIVKIRTALDHAVDFSKHVNAFTTGRACMPIGDIKGGKADIQLRCEPVHSQCSVTPHPLWCSYTAWYRLWYSHICAEKGR